MWLLSPGSPHLTCSTSITWHSSPHLTRWPELDKETVQERLNFDLVTRKLLACLEPVVMAEQVKLMLLKPATTFSNTSCDQ